MHAATPFAAHYIALPVACPAMLPAACPTTPSIACLAIQQESYSAVLYPKVSIFNCRTRAHATSPYILVHTALQRKCLADTILTLGQSGAGGLGRPIWPDNYTSLSWCTLYNS